MLSLLAHIKGPHLRQGPCCLVPASPVGTGLGLCPVQPDKCWAMLETTLAQPGYLIYARASALDIASDLVV